MTHLGQSPGTSRLLALLVALHVLAPLVFFTHLTQNPYTVQIVFLQSVLLGLMAWGGVRLWRGKLGNLTGSPLETPLVAFAVWASVTWTISWFTHGTFFRPGIFHEGLRGNVFLWVNGAAVFFVSLWAPRPDFLRRLMLVVAGVSASYAVMQYVGLDPLWGGQINPFAGRPISTYGNPNFLSSVMVLLLPMALGTFLCSKSRYSLIGRGALSILYVTALVATSTRSSWLGAMFGCALFVFLQRKTVASNQRRALLWGVVVGTILLVWPTSTLGAGKPVQRLVELWDGVTGETVYGSWHQRLLIWRSAWDMWSDRLWIGRGWGLFELFFPYYQGRLLVVEPFQTFRTHANNAHQLVLEIGSQTGMVGLGLAIWIAVVMIRIQWDRERRFTPETSWPTSAMFSGMAGMAADNALGNVSLFFAVPAFLFFWVMGDWARGGSYPREFSKTMPFLKKPLGAMGVIMAVLMIPRLVLGLVGEALHFQAVRDTSIPEPTKEAKLLSSLGYKPDDVSAWYALGAIHAQRMDSARTHGFTEEMKTNANKALGEFERALQCNPSYDELFWGRCNTFRVLGRREEAFLDARMALVLNPFLRDAYLSLLEEGVSSASNIDREDLLERALEAFPNDIEWGLMLADCFEKKGRFDQARNRYEWVLERDLENSMAWNGLLRLSPPLNPKFREGRDGLASIRRYADIGQWTMAHQVSERMIVEWPLFPLPLLISADTAAQLGLNDLAVRRYKEFLRLRPTHKEARENLNKVAALVDGHIPPR